MGATAVSVRVSIHNTAEEYEMAENNGIQHLNDATFQAATADGVVLVDFWAPWCGPCHMQSPILEQVASAIGDSATIAKVDVDQAPQVAAQFGIRSIPTLVVLKAGEVVEEFVGVQNAGTLLRALREAAED